MVKRPSILFYALDVAPAKTSSLGIYHYTRNLLRAMADEPDPGFDLVVLSSKKVRDLILPATRPDWIQVHEAEGDYSSGFSRLWADHVLSVHFASHLKTEAVFYPKGWIPLIPLSKCVVITTMHDQMHRHYRQQYPSYYSSIRLMYWRLLSARSIRRADSILTVSNFSRKQLTALFPNATDRIHVVPEGPGIPLLPCPPPVSDAKTVLVIGSLLPHKRTRESLERLMKVNITDLTIRVTGLAKWPKSWGSAPEGSIHYLGRISDVQLQKEFVQANVLVFLSDMEGFGMPLLEALGHGTPICFRTGHAADEIFGNIPGRWDGRDQAGFEQALRTSFRMPYTEALRHAERILEQANWQKAAREHLRLFRKQLKVPLLRKEYLEKPPLPPPYPVRYQSPRPLVIIQLFNHYLKPGGEATSVERIASHLTAAGHKVIRYHRFSEEWTGRFAPAKVFQAFRMFSNPEALREIRRLQETSGADIWLLHNIQPVISQAVYRLAKEMEVPIVQWLHNYRPISPSGTLFAKGTPLAPDDPHLVRKEIVAGSWRNSKIQTAASALGYQWCFKRGHFEAVKCWVPVSRRMGELFEQSGKLPSERIHPLPHAWDIRPSPPNPQPGAYFLFLGRTLTSKGIGFLVELFARSELKDCELLVAGDGEDRDMWEGASTDNVTWLGWVGGAEKSALLTGCTAVLFPSLWDEPLSTIAYEAYEHGKPLICSRSGGMPEIVEDGITGLLPPPKDADAWLGALRVLQQNPDQAADMGRAGRKWLERNVSPDRWNQQFDEIISTTFSTPRPQC